MTDIGCAGLLHVRLLGELQLRRDGVLLALPASRRTRALLGYLVATGLPQSRSALCDLLWEGPDDPRASLRWSLTKLRAIVDDTRVQRLVADRERVGFKASHCDVDTQRVLTLLEGGGKAGAAPVAVLEAAADLLRGEFLEGLDLPACYRFHQWAVTERERYGVLRRSVLQALVSRLAAEPERALPHGRAMVAADPLAEAAHATLVTLLVAAGRYPEAERHYDWARDLLRREVAIPSGGPLDQAIHRARRERRDAATANASSLSTELPANPAHEPKEEHPLLGRAAESAAIAATLAGTGTARVLLFTGEPGIGKTRLLERFAVAAAAAGRQVIRGRCFEAEMVRPYGLWLDALRGVATHGIDAATLAQAAPLLAGQAAEGGNRERLFDAAAVLLRSLAARRPLALALDDLQWIDEGSAALLHYLARTLGTGSASLFAGAARAGEVHDNVSARSLLHSLAREQGLLRFDLAPLSQADARVLTGAVPIDPLEAWRRSGGNPLYLIELTKAARRGSLDAAAGRGLDALIQSRLLALDDGARGLLAWAAAMGRELRPELLAAAAGLPVAEVLARAERLERHSLLAPTGQGHWDFVHDLVRQALYRSLSPPRRRAIHREFVQALGAVSATDPSIHGEIAHHAELAGDRAAAARACLAAGEFCLRNFANPQAAAVAERGLAHVDALAVDAARVRLEIALLRLLVTAAASAGGRRPPALAERIERIGRATAAAEALDLHEQAAAGWEILAYCQQQASNSGGTREATLAAERMARRGDATARCLQLANSGRCLLDIEADPVRGRILIDEAAALAGELGLEVMEVAWGRGLAARSDGDLDTARAELSRAVAAARAAQNHWREFECMVSLATVEWEQGRHADVLRHVDEIGSAAARMGDPQAPFAQALGALARRRQGEIDAETAFAASVDALRDRDDKARLAYALNEAAALSLEAGRPEAAAGCAREALAAACAVRRHTEIAVATARLACAEPAACDACRAVAEWPRSWNASGPPSARAASAMARAAGVIPTPAPTSRA